MKQSIQQLQVQLEQELDSNHSTMMLYLLFYLFLIKHPKSKKKINKNNFVIILY